jgi:ubiquinone/menaquinone biosynthesis C-methylase UbiE
MKDNFSQQADAYAKYRPQYPEALFAYILNFVKEKNCAWDCGTGNGQSAQVLCRYFNTVIATDISQKQIDNAYKASNIFYAVAPAEKTTIAASSVDLITVSQALHWFNFELFYAEINRVAKPGALIAAWTYSLLKISDEIDAVLHDYHFNTLKNYWDAERKYVDENYRTIAFPFKKIDSPDFYIENLWTLADLEGYLNTWSALQKFIAAEGYSPVTAVIEKIKPVWGNHEKRRMIFPLHLLLAYVNEA